MIAENKQTNKQFVTCEYDQTIDMWHIHSKHVAAKPVQEFNVTKQ